MIRAAQPQVMTGVITFLVCFPYLLLVFSTLGFATLHGGGMATVLISDAVLGALVAVIHGRSPKFARVIPFALVCLLVGLIVQAVAAIAR
jgi:hypothetical protein